MPDGYKDFILQIIYLTIGFRSPRSLNDKLSPYRERKTSKFANIFEYLRILQFQNQNINHPTKISRN